jgi:hypothetical protein
LFFSHVNLQQEIFLKECPTHSTIAGLSLTGWVAAPTKLPIKTMGRAERV